ncbi:MAG TPA: hypothetical protein VKB76_12710 [Ktedonobacterales bacterium]|nr:hypothetical protein [Ktedonobacterales bacterium]
MKYNQPYGITDTNASYINGNPAAGIQGSIVPAEAIEFDQREIVNSILQSGLDPDNGNLQQLWQATQRNPWITHACVDGGTAGAMQATLNPSPLALFYGMDIRIKPAYDCPGPSTLNLNTIGAYPVVRAGGAALAAGDYIAGEVLCLAFDGAKWQIENWRGPPGATVTTNNYTTKIPFAVAGGTANALTATFTPTIISLTAGDPFLIKFTLQNTGAVTIQMDAMPAKPLVWPDQTPMANGDLLPNAIGFMVYDGTSFQMLSIREPLTAVGWHAQNYSGISIPDSSFVPANASMYNSSFRTSTYSSGGRFTVGAAEDGWWVFSLTAQFIPYAGGVREGSCWVVRITGPMGYFSQQNVNDAGNQGNAACVMCVGKMNVGQTAAFDLYHLMGAGYAYADLSGYRIGR